MSTAFLSQRFDDLAHHSPETTKQHSYTCFLSLFAVGWAFLRVCTSVQLRYNILLSSIRHLHLQIKVRIPKRHHFSWNECIALTYESQTLPHLNVRNLAHAHVRNISCYALVSNFSYRSGSSIQVLEVQSCHLFCSLEISLRRSDLHTALFHELCVNSPEEDTETGWGPPGRSLWLLG